MIILILNVSFHLRVRKLRTLFQSWWRARRGRCVLRVNILKWANLLKLVKAVPVFTLLMIRVRMVKITVLLRVTMTRRLPFQNGCRNRPFNLRLDGGVVKSFSRRNRVIILMTVNRPLRLTVFMVITRSMVRRMFSRLKGRSQRVPFQNKFQNGPLLRLLVRGVKLRKLRWA